MSTTNKLKIMLLNRKNILSKALVKNLRRVKEIRSSGITRALGNIALMKIMNDEFPSIVDTWEARKIVTDFKGDVRCLCPLKLIVFDEVKESMKKAFADFLKKKQLLVRFNAYRTNFDKTSSCFVDGKLPDNVLHWVSASGFYWRDTCEGFGFWDSVSREWRDFCLTTTILDDSDKVRENVSF